MPVEETGKTVKLTHPSVRHRLLRHHASADPRAPPPRSSWFPPPLSLITPRYTHTSLFGATVTSWKVNGQEKLFVSSKSALDASKPVSPDAIPEVKTSMATSVDTRFAAVSPLCS